MKIKFLIALFYFFSSFYIFSQDNTFYTTGSVFVGGEDDNLTLYVRGDFEAEGNTVLITQEGLTQITGNFLNNVTAGNVFDEGYSGTVEFCGTDTQYITGSADKTTNYIDFPNVRINNSGSVRLDARMGMQVNELDLNTGRLVLLSAINDSNSTQVDCAHLLVKDGGNVIYNRDVSDVNDKGVVEVQLALGDNYLDQRLVGFSPPFNRIYSDYFTFNFLSKPSPLGLFGDEGMLITDLLTPMNAGEGYIVGQGIVQDESYYEDYLGPEWAGAEYEDRYTSVFSFARDFMPQSIAQYNTQADRFTGETLNITDVTVPLTGQGFHYVGNPFTTPIDMSGFVEETTVADEWGVTRSADATGEVRNAFYVMSGGTGTYDETKPTESRFSFNVSYLLGQAVGGTLSYDGTPSLMIAPMQMFLIGKNTTGSTDFIIPASVRSHGPAEFFRRSAIGCTDEIMIQVQDEDTKAYDRLCVVFREGSTLSSNDPYDASKIFNYSGGVSQIYTRSSDNKKMTTNVIPPETKSINLYLQPSSQSRNVKLSAHRLYSLRSVNTVLLEDKIAGTWTDLMMNPEYTFITNPADNEERFVLHFTRLTTGERIADDYPVIVCAENKQIKLFAISEMDVGSTVTVYDIYGRMMFRDKINTLSEYKINKYFDTGVYTVQLTGKRNSVDKVIVK